MSILPLKSLLIALGIAMSLNLAFSDNGVRSKSSALDDVKVMTFIADVD
jgi:hypothetical protein